MTMLQAFDLAIYIAAVHQYMQVISVGRFVPTDEIRPDTPWAVCVRLGSRLTVLRSADPYEWPEGFAPKPLATKAKPTKPTSQTPVTTERPKTVPQMLFD